LVTNNRRSPRWLKRLSLEAAAEWTQSGQEIEHVRMWPALTRVRKQNPKTAALGGLAVRAADANKRAGVRRKFHYRSQAILCR
jgi:hypothetical protein